MPKKKVIKSNADETLVNAIGMAAQMGVHVPTRKIYVIGEIDRDRAAHFLSTFMSLDTSEGTIQVVLCSEGGGLEHGFAMYDAIKLSNNPVVVDVYGMAQSAAMFILQAGDLRRAAPESRLMIHQGSISIDSASFKAGEMNDHIRELDFSNQRVYRILSESTKGKMSIDDIRKACDKDTYFSAKQAVEVGLIDEVLEPSKKVELQKAS